MLLAVVTLLMFFFCRFVSAAVLKEARAAVGAMITGRAWRRGTGLQNFSVPFSLYLTM